MSDATRIGVAGCGAVSHMYLPTLQHCPAVQIVAVSDVAEDVARAAAERYDVTAVPPDALLDDPSIEIVVNLTPITVHVDVTRDALSHGKHVYSEKSLATSVKDAQALLDEAAARSLSIACAPDTVLWSGFQVARKALHDGRAGRPISATAAMYRSGFSAPSHYTAGAFAFYDMAPYYLSALVSIFGPVLRVRGTTRMCGAGETPRAGAAGAPIMVSGVLEFAAGAIADLTLAWGTEHRSEITNFKVFGSNGVVAFPNPNNFGDPAYVRSHGDSDWTELPGSRLPEGMRSNLRGVGVAEMAAALRAGRAPRASGELACHVVDIVGGLVESGESGAAVPLTTTCTAPEPVPANVRDELFI